MRTDMPTVVHMLDDASRRSPQLEALSDGTISLNYLEYSRCVAGLAVFLRERLAPGDVVLLVMGNSTEMAVAMLGTLAAGMQLCTANPNYTARELKQIERDCAPRVVFTQRPYKQTVEDAVGHRLRPIVIEDAALWMATWLEDSGLALDLSSVDPEALAILQYTGGTSGKPKGVELTHASLVANVFQRDAVLPMREGAEHILCIMPMFHSFASAMCVYLALASHGRLTIHDRYHPKRVHVALTREGITVFPAGPTVFISLLKYEPFLEAPPVDLKWCFSGSAALPEAVLRRWEAVTGVMIYEGYGQTEAGPVLTYNSPVSGFRPLTVGKAVPDTEIQIVDTVTGSNVLPAGQAGEVRARGPQVMRGYRNLPEETQLTLRDGWLYTGDIGSLDDDGYLTISSRKKDLVIVSGYNVYPREIDEVLAMHGSVAESATIGVPDDYRGEVLKAFVVISKKSTVSKEELLDHCAKNLASYKIPAQIVFVEKMPLTSVGKVDVNALRQTSA